MTSRKSRRAPEMEWEQARRRLESVRTAMEGAVMLTPEQAKAVMDERAVRLARVPTPKAAPADTLEVVTFMSDGESYAVETRMVREVVRRTELTPVPGTPAFYQGITQLRGDILPVIMLRDFLGLRPAAHADSHWLVVLGRSRAELAIAAQEVQQVDKLRIDALQEPSEVVARRHVRGVTAEALVLLDAAALLKDTRLFVQRETLLETTPEES